MSKVHANILYTSAGGADPFTSLRIPAVYGIGFFKTLDIIAPWKACVNTFSRFFVKFRNAPLHYSKATI